jgi:two-component system, cell cycle sensor histidine kinase and response regulator CckA
VIPAKRNVNLTMSHFSKLIRSYFERWAGTVIGSLVEKTHFQQSDPAEDGLFFWRERILFSVLTAGTGLSSIALVPAIYMAFSEGLWLLVVIDLCALLINTSLLMLRRVDLRKRTTVVVAITFIVGVSVINQAGFLSGGVSWLFCAAVLAGVLLGLKAALFTIILNAGALGILWWYTLPKYSNNPYESITVIRAVTAWANFLFLNAVTAISVTALVNGMQALNQKIVTSSKALKDERTDLLRTREKLKAEIADRMRSEKALYRSEQKYRLLAENIQDVIWMMDMNLNFTYVSPSIKKMQGWDSDEYMNLTLDKIMKPASLSKVFDAFNLQSNLALSHGPVSGSCSLELELLHKGGASLWAEVTASFLKGKNNHPVGVLGVAHDITGRLRNEKEKQELQESLARSKKMEALGTLAGGVAHDLNNVLSGVVSYPDLLLLDLPEHSPIREPIEIIRESGRKAAAIVNDLLTLARRGVHSVDLLNLNELIEEYLDSPEYQRLASFHPLVEVETQLTPHLLNIMGSPIQLSKTIMNLVSNSAEAIPDHGKITIATENKHFEKDLNSRKLPKGDYAILKVSDSGTGIPAEDLQRIFEPFFTKKKMGRSGTGLGMAVVWGTVQDHKGFIDVKSDRESGTEITVTLPATRRELNASSPVNPLDDYKGNGETLLVVDDMKDQRLIATKIIEQLGYVAKSVESGENAVKLLKNQQIDLLVLDMIMDPGIDGLETYKRIKKINPDQKAIITSGYAESDRAKMAQRMGVGTFLRKPYTVHNLACAIKNELNRI